MATSPVDVLTFGEGLGSVRIAGRVRTGGAAELTTGGAESNVAIGLARLGHSVRFAGRVGDDEVGVLVTRTLRAEGVDVEHLRVDPDRPTGLLLVERRVDDISSVIYHRAGSAGSALASDDLVAALEAGCRVLHASGVTPALSETAAAATERAMRQARDAGATVVFDVNHRSRLWSREEAAAVLGPLARLADVVLASEGELELVADADAAEGAAVAALLEAGVGRVVVKRGGDGASLSTPDARIDRPAARVDVVDSIGAGDAFAAGFISGLLDGLADEAVLDRAVITGAFAVAAAGDWNGAPTRRELDLLDRGAGTTLR